MDERLGKELKAWLEFYRDLGIEEFYRRRPGVVSPPSATSKPGRRAEELGANSTPASPLPARAAESLSPTETVASPAGVGAVPQPSPSAPRPPARSLGLFEAPPADSARPERETLEQIRADLGDCHRCPLDAGRKTIVFGQGNPHAELVFVGEAPGADEDEQGLPFVGRAGQLLNRMIQSVGMKREDVYICNVVKCRPPGNRTPEKDEVDTCSPFLFRQIEAIRPRLVCCLGSPAMKTLLGLKEGITKVRGRFFDFGRAKAFVTFHPAYILRNAGDEKILRQDFEKIREFLKFP